MAIGIDKFLFAEVHIQGLSDWMWRGFSYESVDFQESVKIDLDDGIQLELRMYSEQADVIATPDQETMRRASVIITPVNPRWGDGSEFRRIAEKISRFLSFVTDTHLEATKIEGHAEDFGSFGKSTRTNALLLYEKWPESEEPEFPYLIPIPRYRDVQGLLPDLLKRWFRMYDEWSYPIQLYFIACVEKSVRYAETDLVLAVMALEALHRAQGLQGNKSRARLRALVQPFTRHFGSKEELTNAIERARILRNDCVHGGSESVEEGLGKDLVNSLCFAEALFKLHVMRKLDLDIDRTIKRKTKLALRLQRATQPTHGEDLAQRVEKALAKA